MSKELPDHWRTALEVKGIGSIRGLAARADLSPMAASRLIKGEGVSTDTVNKVADVLFDGDRNRVWRLHGAGLEDHGDWQLPPEASLLTEDQRTAVLAVVRAMLPEQIRGGGAGVRRAAPIARKPSLSVAPVTADADDLADAARDVGRRGSVSRRREEQDAAGEPPADDPEDLDPR